MNWTRKIAYIIFLLGVFFIPFNSFDGIALLGEYSDDAPAYFFLFGFGFLIITWYKNPISLPYKSPLFQVVLIFVGWCMVATLINIKTVATSDFKHTNGIIRFIRQYISLTLSALVFFIFYWNVIRHMSVINIFRMVRKIMFFSLIVAFVYGVLETMLLVFGIQGVYPLMKLFNYFPFLEVRLYGDRISSVSFEAPYLAIYLLTIAGWMFSYIHTSKGIKRFVPTFMVLFLTFFSGSRTGLAVISVQFVGFFIILLSNRQYRIQAIRIAGILFIIGIIVFAVNPKGVTTEVTKKLDSFNFKSNLMKSVSNKSRLGIQYASLQVVKQHPIVGVGYGQQAYHSRYNYPVWATMDNYEFRLIYKNPWLRSFPPGYNLYIRILTETGILGLLMYIFLLFLIFRQLWILIRSRIGDEKVLALVLFISFLGIAINGLQNDSFRIYGFWIFLAILIKMSNLRYNDSEEPKTESLGEATSQDTE